MDALPLMLHAPMPIPASGQPLMHCPPQQQSAVVLMLAPPPLRSALLQPALLALALAQMVGAAVQVGLLPFPVLPMAVKASL
jgi:hypothetical protein